MLDNFFLYENSTTWTCWILFRQLFASPKLFTIFITGFWGVSRLKDVKLRGEKNFSIERALQKLIRFEKYLPSSAVYVCRKIVKRTILRLIKSIIKWWLEKRRCEQVRKRSFSTERMFSVVLAIRWSASCGIVGRSRLGRSILLQQKRNNGSENHAPSYFLMPSTAGWFTRL